MYLSGLVFNTLDLTLDIVVSVLAGAAELCGFKFRADLKFHFTWPNSLPLGFGFSDFSSSISFSPSGVLPKKASAKRSQPWTFWHCMTF